MMNDEWERRTSTAETQRRNEKLGDGTGDTETQRMTGEKGRKDGGLL